MAKRYIDKTPKEIREERSAEFKKRMANLARVGESVAEKGVGIATGIAKEEVFGIPGMFADLSGLAQYVTNPFTFGTNEALQKSSEDLIDDLGASALAAKAGVELSDEIFDEDGEVRPEMIGRMVAPGALYAKGAALIPELSAGVQSLVRGLRNEGFFPAGGPQPATVSGPSPMTQAPDDAGPRSMVVRSESQEPPTGGTAPEKPLVSTERDEMLVSPENEGIINELEITGVKEKREAGVSDTGLYQPLVAAMKNALQDFPKDGIPAAKLLERLRGQPRAGTQIRSIGLDKILQPMGNDRVTREQLGGILGGINPQFKTKVVLSDGGEYALKDGSTQTLPSTFTSYSSLQRQQLAGLGRTDRTQENYGVLLFGDEQSNVDGTYLKNHGHNYFRAQLPGFFGHVRFSIQKIPDPSGAREFITVALIEEIQSDAVKLFQQAERQGKVPTRTQVEKQLRDEAPGLGPNISDVVDARMQTLQKEADERVSRLLGGNSFYGPEEKLTNSFLDLSPEFQKFIELEEIRELATNSDKILQSEGFQLIQNQLDGLHYNGSFRNNAAVHDNGADITKFFLTNGLHKAKSEAEVRSMIDALTRNRRGDLIASNPRGVNNLPAVIGSSNPESQLNAVEILELRTDQLVKEWNKLQKKAEDAIKDRAAEQNTGISSLIQKAIGSRTLDSDMEEFRRAAGATSIRTDLQLKHIAMAGNSITRRFDDALLNARTKPFEEVDVTNLSPEEKTAAGARFLSSDKEMVPHHTKTKMDGAVYEEDTSSPLHETYSSLRKELTINEVRNAVGPEIDDFLNNSAESLRMELDNLEQLDSVFEGVGLYHGSKNEHSEAMLKYYHRDVLKAIGGNVGLKQQKAKLHRDSVIAEVEEAKAKMPTDDEMLKASKSVLENPVVGPMFRRRFSLDESVTPEAVVAAPNVRSLADPSSDTATANLLNQPPFRDQNEFMQFAVRNIPVEMKKLGVDGVVFPRAEEFIAARDSETMGPKDLEKYKVFLDKEARIGTAVQKLQRMKTDDDLISKGELDELGVTNILEELGALDSVVSNNMVDEFRSGTGGLDRKELIEKVKSLMTENRGRDAYSKLSGDPSSVSSDRARKVRGHMQNYGQSLDAGLKKLKMPIIELDKLNVLDSNEGVARQVGGYAALPPDTSVAVAKNKYILGDDVPAEQRRRPVEIPKYRFIDLREGKPGADIAKKVPSAYNRGGHVDVRGGIGAMAREVM